MILINRNNDDKTFIRLRCLSPLAERTATACSYRRNKRSINPFEIDER